MSLIRPDEYITWGIPHKKENNMIWKFLINLASKLLLNLRSKLSLGNLLLGLRASKILVGSFKNKRLMNRLDKLTKIVDKLNKLYPNTETEKMVLKINKDQGLFKDFSAQLEPDKHGDGVNGLKLEYTQKTGLGASFMLPL